MDERGTTSGWRTRITFGCGLILLVSLLHSGKDACTHGILRVALALLSRCQR